MRDRTKYVNIIEVVNQIQLLKRTKYLNQKEIKLSDMARSISENMNCWKKYRPDQSLRNLLGKMGIKFIKKIDNGRIFFPNEYYIPGLSSYEDWLKNNKGIKNIDIVKETLNKQGINIDDNPIIDEYSEIPNFRIYSNNNEELGQLEYNKNDNMWEIICYSEQQRKDLDKWLIINDNFVIWNWY